MCRLHRAVDLRCCALFAGVFLWLMMPLAIQATPEKLAGHIAFVRNDNAFVVAARGGIIKPLPLAHPVSNVSLSPRDGSALYAVEAVKVNKRLTLDRALMSFVPYQSARALHAIDGERIGSLQWSLNGQTMLVGALAAPYLWSPKPSAPKVRLPFYPDSISGDGSVSAIGATAFGGPNQIKVFDARNKRSKIVFSSQKPQALFNLIRRAKLGPLLDCDNFAGRPLSTPSEYWGFGPAAVAPDGKSVYFATNAGAVLSGAGGNTTFCLVKADVTSGKLSLPTHFVWEGARLPYSTRVSPDGRRILLVVASHSSAVDNSSQAYSLDLKTRKMTRLLTGNLAPSNTQANLMGGDCWSPDSRFVALSIFNYDPRKITEQDADKDANYTLFIKEVATGRTIRSIKGAISPSWGA